MQENGYKSFYGLRDSKGNIINLAKKYRAFVFTWNNYPEDWKERLISLEAVYLIGGQETAPTTGTPHIQGYCQFKQQLRISEFAKRAWEVTCTVHGDRSTGISKFEPAYGTPQQNIEYISKEDKTPFTYGELNRQGKRNDIVKKKSDINEPVQETIKRKKATKIRQVDELTQEELLSYLHKLTNYINKRFNI